MAKTETKTKEKTETKTRVDPHLRDKIKGLFKTAAEHMAASEKAFFDASVELAKLYYNKTFEFWSIPDFKSYVESDLAPEGISYRVAMYRVQMGKAIIEHGLTKERIEKIGWSKFKEVASAIIGKSKKQVDHILNDVADMGFDDVATYIKNVKLQKSGEATELTTVTLRFIDDAAKTFNRALAMVAESQEIELAGNETRCAESMALEFMSLHDPEKAEQFSKKVHTPLHEKAPHKEHANKGQKAAAKKTTKKKATKRKATKK